MYNAELVQNSCHDICAQALFFIGFQVGEASSIAALVQECSILKALEKDRMA